MRLDLRTTLLINCARRTRREISLIKNMIASQKCDLPRSLQQRPARQEAERPPRDLPRTPSQIMAGSVALVRCKRRGRAAAKVLSRSIRSWSWPSRLVSP